ncbi:uncharacterized protein LOC125760492 [Anopheles funestus]|nr:uncharacterized protein LOC125760492 [Anopheles funestus]
MQELWLQKIGWDDPVPAHICNKWKSVTDDWKDLADFKSERYVLLPNSEIQFHIFADASEVAYGACIYARCEDQQAQVRVTLLASKSRVAPLKRVTLPRLELCAAVLAVHLHHRVRRAMKIDATESVFWSDSTVTLNWIASPPNTWKTFVANRVAEIQNYSHPRQWKHIPGTSNPADLVSRGMSAAEMLKSSMWRCGPDWLALPASNWPISNPSLATETDMETRQNDQLQNVIASKCSDLGITWHFTPPKAPHFGGLWEAAVKTAKRHLYRHLGSSRLSYEGYCTILQQIEAAMNSRPLLPLTDDPNDLAALTPAHFLIGTSMHAVPVPDYTRLKAYTLDELQSWQLLVQRFWKHWATEYLQEMQKDNKVVNRSEIVPGRLVILVDDSLPITRWPLARIVEIHPGEDQLTRVVKLKTAKGIITRPVTKICLLPVAKPSA